MISPTSQSSHYRKKKQNFKHGNALASPSNAASQVISSDSRQGIEIEIEGR